MRELASQVPTSTGSGGLQVTQADGVAGDLGRDSGAQVGVVMEDADLAEVAGVVAHGHGFTDVVGEREREVAQAVHVQAVAVHDPGAGDGEQQRVELVEAVGQPREPAAVAPAVRRGLAGLGVLALVVAVDEVAGEGGVEFGEGEGRSGDRAPVGAVRDVPGQCGQQLAGDGAEQPLDLAPALRDAGGGVHELDVGVCADLGDVGAGEVGAVVAVEDVGQPADRPRWVGLAPDRLA